MNFKNPLFSQHISLNLINSFLLTILFLAFLSFDANAATYTVTNTNNDGLGSFRKAVNDASLNSSDSFHIINFSNSLIGSTIIVFNEPIVFFGSRRIIVNGTGKNITLSGNNSSSILKIGGTVTINELTIKDGRGTINIPGGIESTGFLTINRSTIKGNNSEFTLGGGILNGIGTLTINNSTISGNTANNGGGIANAGGTVNINNSTITGNVALTNTNPTGGLMNTSNLSATRNGTANIKNSIIANSTGAECYRFSGTVNSENSLIEDNLNCVNGTNTSNITGDPNLAPLQDNGGSTQTHALLAGSPAINMGNNSLAPSGGDQRRAARIVDSTVDIGSFEFGSGFIYSVNKTSDTNDGVCDSDCSLREALDSLEMNSSETIEFAIPVSDSNCVSDVCTLTLTNGQLSIISNRTVKINGTGIDKLIISGNNTSRIFNIDSGAIVELNGITITDGNSVTNGGGINNNGTLTVNDSVIKDSNASLGGGGIYHLGASIALTINRTTIKGNSANFGGGIQNGGGTLTINESTISGNNSNNSFGGGIVQEGGMTTLNNSTISGNNANNSLGGGIYNGSNGIVNLNNATLSNNSADINGGGIYNDGLTSVFNIKNTILANSTNGGDCFRNQGTINAEYSLIEDGLTCLNGTNSNNLTSDPMLGTLQNNEGSTETHALLPNSPAIDAGNPADFLPTDQRGFLRPADGNPLSLKTRNSKSVLLALLPDIGAFEALAPTSANASISGKVLTPKGIGIPRAVVQITDQNGNVYNARTNMFGIFNFSEISVGQTLTFNVFSRKYQFTTQVVNFDDSIKGLDFIAQE